MRRNQRGFTLVELLLSMMIIVVVSGLSIPLYESFNRRNDLDITAQTVASAMRRAQAYSRAPSNDAAWGIKLQSNNIVIFQGTSYAARNATYDETINLPGSITGSGLTEIAFGKLSGAASATGTYNLTSTTNSTKAISVNAKGTIDY